MSKTRFKVAVSLDGYMAGPHQSEEDPIGVGGLPLLKWMFEIGRKLEGREGAQVNDVSLALMKELYENIGAWVIGRNMFGGGPGPWRGDPPWTGWWGENPPFHTPVFVLTHHAREPLRLEGGTTFFFVTDGIDSAMERAKEGAGTGDVMIGGGANVLHQALTEGFVDEFILHVMP